MGVPLLTQAQRTFIPVDGVASSADTPPPPEPGEYLWETDFSNMVVRAYEDETIDLDGLDTYMWNGGPESSLEIVTDVTAPGGRALHCTFTAGGDRTSGIVTQSSTPIPGAGKILYMAIDLEYSGRDDFSGIKKTMRFKSGGTIVGTLNAQYDLWTWDLADSGSGFYPQTAHAETHGPSSFLNTRRRLVAMLDFTDPDAPLYGVWVDGVQVLSGAASAASGYPGGGNVDGAYVSTTFNGPADGGTDIVTKIIFSDTMITGLAV